MERASEASVVKRAERSERSKANKRSECPHGLVDNRFEILTSCSLMQTKDTGPGHWTLDTGHWTEKYARGSPSKNKNIHDANYVHFRRKKMYAILDQCIRQSITLKESLLYHTMLNCYSTHYKSYAFKNQIVISSFKIIIDILDH